MYPPFEKAVVHAAAPLSVVGVQNIARQDEVKFQMLAYKGQSYAEMHPRKVDVLLSFEEAVWGASVLSFGKEAQKTDSETQTSEEGC